MIEKGMHGDIKYHNKKMILSCIRQYSPVSRSEVSQMLHLSKPAVSNSVDELVKAGWVLESPAIDYNKVGKRPVHLKFNDKAGYVFGTDIGGTNVIVALSDVSGNIISMETFQTGEIGQTGFIGKIKTAVNTLLIQTGIPAAKIFGMGVGVPGMTNLESGYVMDAPTLGWKSYNLRKELQQALGMPVYIDNDVNVSVLGEHWLGAAKDMKNVFLIAIGTGVGSGLLINGSLFRGHNWAAGEIGYMVTDLNKAQKNEDVPFEGYGFLDTHVGGEAIKNKMKKKLENAQMHPLASRKETITAKDIFTMAIQDDPLALAIVTEAIDHLSYAIVNAIVLLNPEIVILGGGISKSSHWFLKKVKETVRHQVPFETKIEMTQLGEIMGVIGAISLFLHEHETLLKI